MLVLEDQSLPLKFQPIDLTLYTVFIDNLAVCRYLDVHCEQYWYVLRSSHGLDLHLLPGCSLELILIFINYNYNYNQTF